MKKFLIESWKEAGKSVLVAIAIWTLIIGCSMLYSYMK